jgi:secondary thiamine-phosphate synthase enzyme
LTHSRIKVQTKSKTELVDISREVHQTVKKSDMAEGICTVYIPHTTCGVTINENADPSVRQDIIMELNKVIPFDDGYRHLEGNSAAHIKASLMGASVCIPVSGGQMLLGTWQGIYLCEFDGPRTRSVIVSVG